MWPGLVVLQFVTWRLYLMGVSGFSKWSHHMERCRQTGLIFTTELSLINRRQWPGRIIPHFHSLEGVENYQDLIYKQQRIVHGRPPQVGDDKLHLWTTSHAINWFHLLGPVYHWFNKVQRSNRGIKHMGASPKTPRHGSGEAAHVFVTLVVYGQ